MFEMPSRALYLHERILARLDECRDYGASAETRFVGLQELYIAAKSIVENSRFSISLCQRTSSLS